MTYAQRTWNSEVITDAKLNNIEQGVTDASKWSNEVIDTDKDMNGHDLYDLGRAEVDSVFDTDANGIAFPSQTLQYSKDTVSNKTLTSGTYVLLNTITLGATHVGSSNSFLVRCDVQSLNAGSTAQIKANGLIIATLSDVTTSAYTNIVCIAPALAQGDTIAVYMDGTGTGYAANFRIYADYVLKTVGVDGGSFS